MEMGIRPLLISCPFQARHPQVDGWSRRDYRETPERTSLPTRPLGTLTSDSIEGPSSPPQPHVPPMPTFTRSS